MPVIDPNRTWAPLEERLAITTDKRHRVVLKAVIEHMKAEAAADLDRLMATLSPTPAYHFWSEGNDTGPKGTNGVRTFYSAFVASKSNVLEYALDRLVLDDHCLVTEGFLKQIYPGSYAAQLGFPVDDESADYLIVHRQLLLWPVDEHGLIQGEDSYSTGPVSITKLSLEELPQQYIDLVHSSVD
ncbi:hypothetical protein [Streptomyces sp. NPDC001948]